MIRPVHFALFLLAPAILLGGCTQFPQLDAVEGPDVINGEAPRLLPLQDLLDASAPLVTAETGAAIASRVAALRARADRLSRGAVVDATTKRRMALGVRAPE